VRVNCATLPASLAESELFGHTVGSFTGATRQVAGFVAGANGGTLFLNEIDSLPIEVQAQLLSFLDDRSFNPLGSNTPKRVDVRVVAASNANLNELVCQGRFRRDLYFRLKQFTVHLPPLRERTGDIGMLAEHFLKGACDELGVSKELTSSALDRLDAYDWPGNVRELRNVVRRACRFSATDVIQDSDLEIDGPVELPERQTYKAVVAAAARAYVKQTLASTSGNATEAARRADLPRTELYRLLKRHGINIDEFRRVTFESRNSQL
jgi:DNA-binding NtrC family response regulator